MPSLAEFQRGFADALGNPDAPRFAGVQSAGLRIHRNTFMKALVDALLANYPTVGVLMGAEWLASAAQAYAQQHPPLCAVLADYGDLFPEFLRAMDVEQAWPYLPGVAQLDRAWTHSLLAQDAPALKPERLRELAPEALASLQLRLHPSARHGVHAHSAVTVWRANRPPATPPVELQVDGCDEAAIMVRNDDGVQLLPLDAGSHVFLNVICAGGGAAAAASAALQEYPGTDIAGTWSRFLSQGVFADIENHGD